MIPGSQRSLGERRSPRHDLPPGTLLPLRVLFVINALSGPRRRNDLHAVIQQNCSGWTYDVVPCGTKEDLHNLVAQASASGVKIIYAVGGDGTVHEIARHLIGTPLALGVLPTGSGNGFARHLGLPLQSAASLRACRGLRVQTIDTATVNGRPFVGVMGLGFDAWIAEAFAGAAQSWSSPARLTPRDQWCTKQHRDAWTCEVVRGRATRTTREVVVAR